MRDDECNKGKKMGKKEGAEKKGKKEGREGGREEGREVFSFDMYGMDRKFTSLPGEQK